MRPHCFFAHERLFTQVHHIASPKQKVGPWTPQFEALLKQAGMTLEDAANKVNVLGHEGPHPQDYHKEVYRRLTEAVKKEKPGSAQFKAALVKELKLLAKDCATWGKPLNQMIVKGIFRKR